MKPHNIYSQDDAFYNHANEWQNLVSKQQAKAKAETMLRRFEVLCIMFIGLTGLAYMAFSF